MPDISADPQIHLLVISPVYNEAAGIAAFVREIGQLRRQLAPECELRLLLVEDGSADPSFEKIRALAGEADWLRYRRLTGNFGHQAALIAGLAAVDGWAHAVVTMDSDLEHPPEKIPEMLTLWKAHGLSVVQTRREELRRLPLRKRLLSKLFYAVTSKLTGLELHSGQADFALWDARLIRSLEPYLQHIGSLRVFSAWVPGEKRWIPYRQGHSGRASRYTFGQNWNLALNSIIRFSNVPLRLITWLGALGIAVSALHLVQIVWTVMHDQPLAPGWFTLIVTVIFMSCLQLMCLGILASYLRRLVFSKDLPLFLVKEEKLH